MSKTNIIQNTTDNITEVAQQAGIILMAAAATLGLFDLPSHPENKIVLPTQPAFEMATLNDQLSNSTLRREREETGPHYVSYNISQRTPSRTGKQ